MFSKIKHFDENGNKPMNQYTANKVLVNSKSEDISFGEGSGQGKATSQLIRVRDRLTDSWALG